ncbi:MAG TPA: hypothetical protein PK821_08250, partial [Victivallales bacterium]|nr:hypothetical protein [Victivallales bacterium]
MKVVRGKSDFKIEGKTWRMFWRQSNPRYVDLKFSNGIGAELLVFSACDRDEMIDELVKIGQPEIKESAKTVVVKFDAETTLWKKAEYTFTCTDEQVLYGYRVHGKGRLDNARFFEGFLQEKPQLKNTYLPTYCGWSRESS